MGWPVVQNGWVEYDERIYARADYLLLLSLEPSNLARLVTSAGPSYQFQPVTSLSYALDQAAWGDDCPAGFHAVDLALYALLSGLVAAWARAVARDLPAVRARAGTAAFAAGAAFAAHPVHVESYAWIADRKDVLAALFALAALLLERAARRGAARPAALRAAAGLALALSLGAKVAAMGLGLFVAADAALDPATRALRPALRARRALRAGAPYLALGLAGALVWLHLQRGTPMPLGGDRDSAGDALTRLLFPLRCLGAQLRLLAWPLGMAIHHVPHPDAWSWARDLLPLGGGLALLVGLARRSGASRALALLALVWLLVGLGPTLNLVPLGFVNERYLLLPSVGLAVAGGGLFALARATRPALALTAGLLLLGAWSGLSARRIRDWADPQALWGALVRDDPLNPHGHLGLALTRLRAGDPVGAEALAREAEACASGSPVALAVREAALRARGDLTGAEALFARRSDPGARLIRAERAAQAGDLATAREHVEAVLRRFPAHREAQVVLGKLLLAAGQPAAALEPLESAAHHLASRDATLHAALAALLCERLGRCALHLEVLERPGPTWRSRLLAARLADAQGRRADALEAVRRARALLPAEPGDGWDQVALALALRGELGPAAELLEALLARDRASPAVVYDLARIEAVLGRETARRRLSDAVARDPALRARAAGDPALRGLLE